MNVICRYSQCTFCCSTCASTLLTGNSGGSSPSGFNIKKERFLFLTSFSLTLFSFAWFPPWCYKLGVVGPQEPQLHHIICFCSASAEITMKMSTGSAYTWRAEKGINLIYIYIYGSSPFQPFKYMHFLHLNIYKYNSIDVFSKCCNAERWWDVNDEYIWW